MTAFSLPLYYMKSQHIAQVAHVLERSFLAMTEAEGFLMHSAPRCLCTEQQHLRWRLSDARSAVERVLLSLKPPVCFSYSLAISYAF